MPATNAYCNEKVARVIVYEFNMFQFLGPKLAALFMETGMVRPGHIAFKGTGDVPEPTLREWFALLESFLLHTRVLMEFFYCGRPEGRDRVIASDFIPKWDSRCRKLCPEGKYLAKRHERLNKALVHLSVRRVKYETEEKRWDVDRIRRALDKAIEVFKEKLPGNRQPWFEDRPLPQ